ncbi:MAG: S9 family peptidase, partial [Candidatus Hydrogenedentota bacterium]
MVLTNKQVSVIVLAGLLLLPAMASAVEPPVAKIEPKVDTVLGTVMVDNYFWLRGKEKPEVIAYLEAENEYTQTIMKHTEELQEKLYQEILGRIKETDLSVPVKDDDYYYYSRDEEGKQYKIYCRKKGSLEADEEIMLDVNVLAEGQEFMSLGTFEVSPDHRLLAYATDTAGNERYTLRVKNLETGELFTDVIANISGALEWANDNKTFFYTIPDEAWRPYKLYRHTLGADAGEDQLVYHEADEGFWLNISKTKSEAYLMMKVGSQTTDECHYLDADEPFGAFTVIHPRQHELEYAVYHHGDRFFILTNDEAKNFKLMEAPLADPSKENWKEIVPHRKEVKLDGLDVFKDFLVIYQREGGLRNIHVWDLRTDKRHNVEFPEPVYTCYGQNNPDFNSHLLRFTYMSMITPNSVFDYDMATRERELKKQREVLGGYDPNEYQSERVFAKASDGTKIPISMVYRKGMVKNGENPLYLYGYGAYGASMDPWFSSSRLSLLDRGFIYAVA